MKKFLFTFLILTGFLSYEAIAQKQVNEASLIYDVIATSSDGKSEVASLKGATLQIWVKGNQSRSEMKTSLGIETSIHDNAGGKAVVLKEYSAQKLMITYTSSDWQSSSQTFSQSEFKPVEGSRTINNYVCKEAVAQGSLGTGEVRVWYHPEIQLNNKAYFHAFPGISGLPIQYVLLKSNLRVTYTLRSISYEPIPASKFDWPKSGYRIMTYEENLQLNKGK
jgi:hypothetical protein